MAERVARDRRREMVRTRNDARAAQHQSWVLRMETLEARLRTVALAERNRALLERVRVD